MTADSETVAKAMKALGLSTVVPQVYSDLLAPAARELGGDLLLVAKAVSMALSPLRAVVWGYDQISAWLSVTLTRLMARLPPEQVCTPPLSLAGPILFRLQFVQDEEALRQMYATLLASAMDRSTASRVHPAFAQVIEQLSSEEALVLRQIATERPSSSLGIETTTDGWSLTPGSDWIDGYFESLCRRAGLTQLALGPTYLDNLLRLRLLRVGEWSEVTYQPGGQHRYGDYGPSVEQKSCRELAVTEFGQRFLDVCVGVN